MCGVCTSTAHTKVVVRNDYAFRFLQDFFVAWTMKWLPERTTFYVCASSAHIDVVVRTDYGFLPLSRSLASLASHNVMVSLALKSCIYIFHAALSTICIYVFYLGLILVRMYRSLIRSILDSAALSSRPVPAPTRPS